jgi:phosphotransferase system enzyme I (PtsP)
MQIRRGDEQLAMVNVAPNPGPAEPTLRLIMRRLREIMAGVADGQSRLDQIVRHIAGLMVAEVCSIYLRRQDGSLELFATEGLNPDAVHRTFMRRGEGLVGRSAELGVVVNEPDAANHPAFSFRPETGEEIYHSFLAVPIQRGGTVLGVLTVQNKTHRTYSDEDVEVLATTAMVLAEYLVSGAVPGAALGSEAERSATVLRGQGISEGLALGHAVLHAPREVVTELTSEDSAGEARRLENAVEELRAGVDEMLAHEGLGSAGEHRDVLEAYRMLAYDRGWLRRMLEAVKSGLTAEASVERVQNDMRARMLRNREPHWRERQKDFDALSDRLLRTLAERAGRRGDSVALPEDAILVARTLGPADLLEYDRARLRGLVVEDGSGQSHVAVVARALGIAAVGQARGIVERVTAGMALIVDAETGEVHLNPTPEVINAYADKARFRARLQSRYRALADRPSVSKDGVSVSLMINAGLQVDTRHLEEAGADGIGLFRTELLFMTSTVLPRLERQTQMYRSVIEEARGRPVVFRTLDIGADKTLPYLRPVAEMNPALGWRALRMTLDRSGLMRTQLRALLRAAAGYELTLMLPMVTTPSEVDAARAVLDKEIELATRRGQDITTSIRLGAMIEVPSLLFELEALMGRVDFVSVGSNDLMQYLFAADRTNERVATRYDSLSFAGLSALSRIVEAGRRHGVPVNVCGEMAGRPLEAMALIALGYRTLSMAPAAVGPVKSMLMSLDVGALERYVARAMSDGGHGSLRAALQRFAEANEVEA